MKRHDEIMSNNAKCLSKILKDPTGLAVVCFRFHSAMINAGFTNEQAMDLTKHIVAMIIGIGGTFE